MTAIYHPPPQLARHAKWEADKAVRDAAKKVEHEKREKEAKAAAEAEEAKKLTVGVGPPQGQVTNFDVFASSPRGRRQSLGSIGTHTYVHTYTHRNTHMRANAHTHTPTHKHTHLTTLADYKNLSTRQPGQLSPQKAHKRTYTHTHAHKHTHKRTHTHILEGPDS